MRTMPAMKKEDIIRSGRDVMTIEAEAVKAVASTLGHSFAQAVELLSKAESRVIVTGVGKSGLIGRKIAATLSSCGTPALFVHPVEAGHGDLGMIVKKDIILAISYSGETGEIMPLLNFAKRVGIKLIGITGNKKSKLARFSDVVIEAQVPKEAEPSGMVPTSSSTAALATGDALAITLMKKKGFSEQEFVFFHPKGEAGKKLLKVKTLMHKGKQVPSVLQTTLMPKVLEEMSGKKLGMTCVVDRENKLVGIITDGDLRRQLQKKGKDMINMTAGECMTSHPFAIHKEELATKALHIMEEHKITSLIVKNENEEIEGIIHLHDLWRTEML